jgi:hypothetical protein
MCCVASFPQWSEASMTAALVIVNVRVVDVRSATVSEEMDVTIDGGRIASIREAAKEPRTGEILDAGGGYLMPGMWDMHAHLNFPDFAAQWMMPMMLAAGVTGVRDMAGDCWAPNCPDNIGFMQNLKQQSASGDLPGPGILAIGSALVHGPQAIEPNAPAWSAPATAAQARELVRLLAARGVDFIKPYDTLPKEAYFAMLKEARKYKLPVSGHVPLSVSSTDAVRAGQRTIEHARHPALDCSRYSPEFHRTFAQWADGKSNRIYQSWAKTEDGDENLGGHNAPILAAYDEARCQRVIRAIARSGAYYVPSLITRRFEALAHDADFVADSRLAGVPPHLRAAWAADARKYQESFEGSAALQESRLRLYQLAVQLVGKSHAAGVPVLVGTDSPDSYCFPGSSFHDELRELRSAGMSNGAILRAATLSAAEFLGQSASFGTVEPGKAADLVLLKANPLDNIDHAREVIAVVLRGRLFDSSALRALEARAAAFVSALPATDGTQ